MIQRRFVFILCAVLALAAVTPARAQYNAPAVMAPPSSSVTVITTDPAILYPPAREFKIVPGDVLKIGVFGQSEFGPTVHVDFSGNVDLPFLGSVHLADMTLPEAQHFLAERLRSGGVYTDPEVTITVTEGPNAAVTVVGENHASVPLVGQRGLLEVLNAAGGLGAATSHVITINRPDVPTPIVVDLGTDPAHSAMANIPVFPGDIIVTGKVGVAFAVGAFKTPGTIPLAGNTPVTLMEATAVTGGAAYEAKMSDLRLIRTVNGQRTVVKLNMQAVLEGKSPDPVLQPNDILYLPSSAWKASIQNGSASLGFSLVSLALSVFNSFRY